MSTLKTQLTDDMKTAMRAQEKQRLAAIRLINAAIKQKEVDERIEVTDEQVIALLDKMAKQRRESISAFEKAGRDDLIAQEQYELEVISAYLPEGLSDEEIVSLIEEAIQAHDAKNIKDMGKVMGALKPKMQGRADMGKVSALIKQKLS